MDKPERKEIKFRLFPKQYSAFNFETQFAAAIAGVQSGKTFVGSVWTNNQIMTHRSKDGIIAAPTYKILNQSTLKKFFQNFPKYRRFYNKSENVIQLPDQKLPNGLILPGGSVYCRSMDEPLGVEGITAHWFWGDEAGQYSRFAWTVLRSRVAMTRGKGFLTTTPYAINYLHDDFFVPWRDGTDTDLSVYSWASIENPDFPKEHYEAEKRRLTPEEFARRYQGVFSKMEGLVYDLPPEQIIDPIPLEQLNVKAIIVGVDFGFNVPAALITIVVTADNVFYVVDETYKARLDQDEIEGELSSIRNKWHFQATYPDPAEPDRVSSMKKKKFNPKPVDKSKGTLKTGISTLNALIRQKRLFVFNSCPFTIDEFNTYHYDPEASKDEPVKANDHAMDAIRYAICNFEPVVLRSYQQSGGVKPLIPGVVS